MSSGPAPAPAPHEGVNPGNGVRPQEDEIAAASEAAAGTKHSVEGEVEMESETDGPVPSRSDVFRVLRETRANAKKNAKKTRMAFDAAKAATESGLLRTDRFKKPR